MRSKPLRTPGRTSSGSGMQYRPRGEISPVLETVPGPDVGPTGPPEVRTKTRSQPFRRAKVRTGLTFPVSKSEPTIGRDKEGEGS